MNIVMIMCDSLPPHDVGCYGDRFALTPNIDRLSASGVTFERAYCNSPLCAPSRASFMSGRYCSELGVLDNAHEYRADTPTLAYALRAAGYETTLCGKMHFVGHDQMHGFNQRFATKADYSHGFNPGAYRIAYDWERHGKNPAGPNWMGPSYVYGPEYDHYPHHYDFDQLIHAEALKFLSTKDKDSKPFFCCLSYHTPHNPFWIPEQYKQPFKGKKLPLPKLDSFCHSIMDRWLNEFHHAVGLEKKLMNEQNLTWLYETYYGMVHYLDCLVGEVIAKLEAQGLRENTAIVFTSDHGDMLCHRGLVQKRCFYERSARVPLIFTLPGQRQAGARSNELVSLLDLFPTFAQFGGAPLPEVRGKSLVPVITENQTLGERIIFSEYHGEGVHAPCFMARRSDHKYIYVHGHDEHLYNVATDPEELRPLALTGANRKLADTLKAEIIRQFNPDALANWAKASQRDRHFIFDAVNAEKTNAARANAPAATRA